MKNGQEILKEDDFWLYRVTWAAEPSRVQFELFEIQGYAGGQIISEEKSASVFVKWDGCSDWTFDPDEEGPHHFCGVQGLHRFLSAQIWIYAKAADLFTELGESPDLEEFILDSKKPAV